MVKHKKLNTVVTVLLSNTFWTYWMPFGGQQAITTLILCILNALY